MFRHSSDQIVILPLERRVKVKDGGEGCRVQVGDGLPHSTDICFSSACTGVASVTVSPT